jgi:lipoprotein-anchoring transpeptidase ErfK/SrfK
MPGQQFPRSGGVPAHPLATFPPKLFGKNTVWDRRSRGIFTVRVCVSLFVVASSVVGFAGTALAQSYYPPPPAYYPPPPYYGEAPQYYGDAPVPPRNVGRPGPYDPVYGEEVEDYPPPVVRGPARASSADVPRPPGSIGASADVTGSIRAPGGTVVAGLPPEDQPEAGAADLPQQFRRQMVAYPTNEPAGTIVIDTAHTYLYLVLGGGRALRYGVGVGREGFTWTGTERISRMSEWPDWHPPKEMIERQPYLPRFMAGGEGNPLGARAMYLGSTVYRIHGTNQPSTIGSFVSSGCIRLTNEDVSDLYSRVGIGTRVVVLPGAPPVSASAQGPTAH